MKKIGLSIITPVFNRRIELTNLYESLIKQDSKNFEWIIVDDGSSESLIDLIEKWSKELSIRFQSKKNGGKASAVNIGVNIANGDYIVVLDSDDKPIETAVNTILNEFSKLSINVAGIGFLMSDKNGKICSNSVEEDRKIMTILDAYSKFNYSGDKWFVFRADILKQYPWPIFQGEKLAPESIVYNRLSRDNHKVCFINKVILIIEYQEDGYSRNYLSIRKNSPIGYFLVNFENVISLDFRINRYYLKSVANIVSLLVLCSRKTSLIIFSLIIAIPIGIMKGVINRIRYNYKYKKSE